MGFRAGLPWSVHRAGVRVRVRPLPYPGRWRTGVVVGHGRWTYAQALELRGPRISNACTDLQPLYPTLTPLDSIGPGRAGLGSDCSGVPVAHVGRGWTGGGKHHCEVVENRGCLVRLGQACADRLADDGWHVGASRRGTCRGRWQRLVMDVDDDPSAEEGVAEVMAEYDHADGLVTAADGGWRVRSRTPPSQSRRLNQKGKWRAVKVVRTRGRSPDAHRESATRHLSGRGATGAWLCGQQDQTRPAPSVDGRL